MSSTTVRTTQITDLETLERAIANIPGAHYGGVHMADFYSGRATGRIVQLPGWKYPVVINPDTGEMKYDNYSGHWGKLTELHRLLQEYAVATCEVYSERLGAEMTHEVLPNGEISITLRLDGVPEVQTATASSDLPV